MRTTTKGVVLTMEQHMIALQRANEIRLARAALKRQVAAGQTSVGTIIGAMPDEVRNMPIDELIMAQRRWGRTRVRKLLAGVPVSEGKPIGKLTPRQRRAIADRVAA